MILKTKLKNMIEKSIFEKNRRNSRVLSKFYDAQYIDIRDGKKKSGQQLSCGRTNRNHDRDSENLKIFRGQKLKKGEYRTRKQRYSFQKNDTVRYQGRKYRVIGMQNRGDYIKLEGFKPVSVKKVNPVSHCGGWRLLEK